MVTLQLRQLHVPPGQKVLFDQVSWDEFENILAELGEHRASRLTYDNGILEIMTPLPEYEDNKEIIGDLIKVFLEELDIEFRSLGSTTFKSQIQNKGVEPDQCFYIANESKIRGKKRIDLTVDPPPDLVIEIEITSPTNPSIYEALGVPELWQFDGDNLKINCLKNGQYVEVCESEILSNIPIKIIVKSLKDSKISGRNKVVKAFRKELQQSIKNQ